jgi:hypothetical protein
MARNHAGPLVTGLFAALLAAHPVWADCQLGTPMQPIAGVIMHATPTAPLGQSFVACQDGLITGITVTFNGSTQPSVRLGLQSGTDILAPTYTETINVISPRMMFSPSFPVKGGEVYSLSITPASGVVRLFLNGYAGGTLLTVENGLVVERPADLQFLVSITDPPVPATLATWGALKSTYR